MARQVKRTITIDSTPEQVFDALIKPSSIKAWWLAHSAIIYPKTGGHYALTWGIDENNPDFITMARISVFERPNKLTLSDFDYYSKAGALPFKANLQTEFIIENKGEHTDLTVIQSGFPDDLLANQFYFACLMGWETTLASLKRFLEMR
jgi:uncharacterized protein YndB with AHSA1/START domain